MERSCNPNYKPLLSLIFENYNKHNKKKVKYAKHDIETICAVLSSISKFIEHINKAVKSSHLTDEKKIEQIQRFKDSNGKPIFNNEYASKLLKLMNIFVKPGAIHKRKKHLQSLNNNPTYRNCYNMLTKAPINNINKQSLTDDEKEKYIKSFQCSLSNDELKVLSNIANGRVQAGGYKSFVDYQKIINQQPKQPEQSEQPKQSEQLEQNNTQIQTGGDNNMDDKKAIYSELMGRQQLIEQNQSFFKALFHRISMKVQEDKDYGTLDSVNDYKQRLERYVREAVQEIDVPDNLKYFVDNITNLVDAIYPSNILEFTKQVKNSPISVSSQMKNEFAEPFELMELVLFTLSVIPVPIVNMIPDFLMILNNIVSRKRIMFTILLSITLVIKIVTLLFFDFGPILKLFYLAKKIKNFNFSDLSKVLGKNTSDILLMPGTASDLGSGMVSKEMVQLASAGPIRPDNLEFKGSVKQIHNKDLNSGTIAGPGYKLTPEDKEKQKKRLEKLAKGAAKFMDSFKGKEIGEACTLDTHCKGWGHGIGGKGVKCYKKKCTEASEAITTKKTEDIDKRLNKIRCKKLSADERKKDKKCFGITKLPHETPEFLDKKEKELLALKNKNETEKERYDSAGGTDIGKKCTLPTDCTGDTRCLANVCTIKGPQPEEGPCVVPADCQGWTTAGGIHNPKCTQNRCVDTMNNPKYKGSRNIIPFDIPPKDSQNNTNTTTPDTSANNNKPTNSNEPKKLQNSTVQETPETKGDIPDGRPGE